MPCNEHVLLVCSPCRVFDISCANGHWPRCIIILVQTGQNWWCNWAGQLLQSHGFPKGSHLHFYQIKMTSKSRVTFRDQPFWHFGCFLLTPPPMRPLPCTTHHPALMGFVLHSPFLCIMIIVMMLTDIFITTNTSAAAGVTRTATSATTTEHDNHDRVWSSWGDRVWLTGC